MNDFSIQVLFLRLFLLTVIFRHGSKLFRGCYSCVPWTFHKMTRYEMAGNVEQSPFISFVNKFDYSSTSIPRKHPRNEQVTSAEELGTMSKNNLRGITVGIRHTIWRIHSLTSSFLGLSNQAEGNS